MEDTDDAANLGSERDQGSGCDSSPSVSCYVAGEQGTGETREDERGEDEREKETQRLLPSEAWLREVVKREISRAYLTNRRQGGRSYFGATISHAIARHVRWGVEGAIMEDMKIDLGDDEVKIAIMPSTVEINDIIVTICFRNEHFRGNFPYEVDALFHKLFLDNDESE
jgi:hypothetical protein